MCFIAKVLTDIEWLKNWNLQHMQLFVCFNFRDGGHCVFSLSFLGGEWVYTSMLAKLVNTFYRNLRIQCKLCHFLLYINYP